MAQMQAAMFINWTIPVGMGHTGWGFQAAPDKWYFGGLETAGVWIGPGSQNNTNNCIGTFADMIRVMKGTNRPNGGGDPKKGGYPYHEYKLKTVNNPNLNAALNKVMSIRCGGYNLHGFNCCDAVFNVIKAYDNNNDTTLPWPSTHWAPRSWYSAIPGKGVFMQPESVTGGMFAQHGGPGS